jgi:hypothetical protein
LAFVGEVNAFHSAPAFDGKERSMIRRRRFKQSDRLEDRLAAEAIRLHEEANTMEPGAARDDVLRKARQAETGSHMSEWLRSADLQAPK